MQLHKMRSIATRLVGKRYEFYAKKKRSPLLFYSFNLSESLFPAVPLGGATD